jgi:kynurenine 3-monooxygenase
MLFFLQLTTAMRVPALQMAASQSQKAAIIGGGPAGLLSAIMLARRGWQTVDVYDALAAPPKPDDPTWAVGERSYQLGLNGRGQNSLAKFDCLAAVDPYAAYARGRLSFVAANGKQQKVRASPAARTPAAVGAAGVGAAGGFTPTEQRLKEPGTPGAEKTYTTRVLQRDRLQACLLAEIESKYSECIRVTHECTCSGVDISDGDLPIVRFSQSSDAAATAAAAPSDAAYDLVIGADGVRSSVRGSLEALDGATTRTVRFEENNERRYKTLPLHPSLVPGSATDLNWGYRNASLGLGMDALPTMEGEMVAVLLFKPGSAVYGTIEGLRTAAEARTFLEESLPPIASYVRDDDLERFVLRPVSRLPSFQMVEGDIHAATKAGGVVLLGDSIKAVKPYFGQGANSALEDVVILERCLEESGDTQPAAAAAAFTIARAEDARALVRVSRSFDGPGPLGTARFLLPLLLDIQLNKLLPALFSPPLLRGLQDERNTFVGLVARKRTERAVLVGLVGSFTYLVRATIRQPTGPASQVLYSLSMLGVGFGGAKGMRFVREGGLAKLNPRALAFGAIGAAFSTVGRLLGAPLALLRSSLRALLLKLDPSLAEDEGKTLGWKDVPMPGLGKLAPKPPKPPWQQSGGSGNAATE